MLTPLKNIPIKSVIETISGYKIIPFDKNDEKDIQLLEKLKNVAAIAGREINKNGIKRKRANEVGNGIELFVKNALNGIGYKATTPLTKKGIMKTSGYPDIEFTDEFGRTNYLECKTLNKGTTKTTQRSFYLSPSDDFKITKDAHHFMISYEIYVDGSEDKKNIYKCESWKLLSVENLTVDVKYEFNSNNKRMYTDKLILTENNI